MHTPIRVLRVAIFATALALAPQGIIGAQKPTPAPSAVPAHPDAPTILHVLNRAGYGPKPGDIERVRAMGLAAYIEQQLHPEQIPDVAVNTALAQFPTLTMSTEELAVKYYRPLEAMRRDQQQKEARAEVKTAKAADDMMAMQEAKQQLPDGAQQLRQEAQSVLQNLMQARIVRAVDSDRQLNEVLVDFWFNHFNVYAQKGAVNEYLNAYERDAIRPHVLGNFRDMLGAVAHDPAMLFYLDNFQSADPKMGERDTNKQLDQIQQRLNNPRARLTPEQREQALARIEQLKKNIPRGLNENYARELMELHTLGVDGGYAQKDVQEVARVFTGWTIDQPRGGGKFIFRPAMHDAGNKTVLGQTIAGADGQDGEREGERVLDLLAMHPATARRLAYKLSERFVSDVPPASLVDRVAKVYLDTKGDLRAVTRAILTSPEFYSVEAYNAKVKTPLDFVVSAARATDARLITAAPVVQALRTTLGMPLYGCQPPTGYKTTADAWVNTGALLSRMNFGLQLVSNQQRAIRVNVMALAPDTSADTRAKLVDNMLAGRISASTSATLAKAPTPQQLLTLLLGSPEFQKR
ncbi:MAG: DUF1800 domain-containing protein [Acidobacteria bacterium]|nr:DUF1800 domain-containing protein [Acidobacteriota bacterium]